MSHEAHHPVPKKAITNSSENQGAKQREVIEPTSIIPPMDRRTFDLLRLVKHPDQLDAGKVAKNTLADLKEIMKSGGKMRWDRIPEETRLLLIAEARKAAGFSDPTAPVNNLALPQSSEE